MAHQDFSPEHQLNHLSENSSSQSAEQLPMAKAMSFDMPQTSQTETELDWSELMRAPGFSGLKRLQDKSKFKKAHFGIRLFQNPWLNLFKD